MARAPTLKSGWYKRLNERHKGAIGFDELQYVVYSFLQISKLELPVSDVQLLWAILDPDAKGVKSVAEFAAFLRKIERGKVDIDDWVATQGDALSEYSLATTALPRRSASEAHIGGYSSLDKSKSFQMGRPPENNDVILRMVPRLKSDLVFRQQQKLKFLETLTTGGVRYPLMINPRRADRPFAVDATDLVRTHQDARAHSVHAYSPLPVLSMNAHWSERLACNPTHAALTRQHATFLDLKHKYK